MTQEIELESREWYVLCNWLREHENATMYALRERSGDLRVLQSIRGGIERQRRADADHPRQRVALHPWEWDYLQDYLGRRARRLLLRPWRDRERRDVRHLRRHLRAQREGEDR